MNHPSHRREYAQSSGYQEPFPCDYKQAQLARANGQVEYGWGTISKRLGVLIGAVGLTVAGYNVADSNTTSSNSGISSVDSQSDK